MQKITRSDIKNVKLLRLHDEGCDDNEPLYSAEIRVTWTNGKKEDWFLPWLREDDKRALQKANSKRNEDDWELIVGRIDEADLFLDDKGRSYL